MDRRGEQEIAALLETVGESYAPGMDFMYQMAGQYKTEIDALIGRSALDHPGQKETITIAERYYEYEIDDELMSWRDLMEVDRTLMNVWFFRTLMDPDEEKGYVMITGANNTSPVKMSHESYEWLRALTHYVLPDEERQHAMEIALINADLGKSAALQKDMSQKYGRDYADHDALFLDVLQDDEMTAKWTPSYAYADPRTKQTILNNFQSGYHMPQGLQGEAPTAKLAEFVQMPLNDQMFGLLLGLLDIAGSGGDKVQDRSVTLIEPLVRAFQSQVEAVWAGAESGLEGQELALFIDNAYLASRAKQWGITLDQPYGRQLARLGCGMRFSNEAQMHDLITAVNNEMLPEDRDDLMELLAYTGFEPEGHIWIMYLPDLIRVYAETLQKLDRTMPRAKAYDAGLTMAARTYRNAKDSFDYSQGLVVVTRDMVDAYENQPGLATVRNISVNMRAPGEAWAQFAAS